jgi:hypothetical protein
MQDRLARGKRSISGDRGPHHSHAYQHTALKLSPTMLVLVTGSIVIMSIDMTIDSHSFKP